MLAGRLSLVVVSARTSVIRIRVSVTVLVSWKVLALGVWIAWIRARPDSIVLALISRASCVVPMPCGSIMATWSLCSRPLLLLLLLFVFVVMKMPLLKDSIGT